MPQNTVIMLYRQGLKADVNLISKSFSQTNPKQITYKCNRPPFPFADSFSKFHFLPYTHKYRGQDHPNPIGPTPIIMSDRHAHLFIHIFADTLLRRSPTRQSLKIGRKNAEKDIIRLNFCIPLNKKQNSIFLQISIHKFTFFNSFCLDYRKVLFFDISIHKFDIHNRINYQKMLKLAILAITCVAAINCLQLHSQEEEDEFNQYVLFGPALGDDLSMEVIIYGSINVYGCQRCFTTLEMNEKNELKSGSDWKCVKRRLPSEQKEKLCEVNNMDQIAMNMINSATTYLKDNEGNIKLFDLENKRVGTLQIIPQTQ